MNPVRLWFGLVLLAMAGLAVLDGADVIAWDRTFGEWWPLAVIGWGVADMVADRSLSLSGLIITAVGLTLLSDEQGWAAESLVWSVLFLIAGVAILVPGLRAKREEDREGQQVAHRA